MKFALLVVALAQVATCGNVGVRTSSLLSPAGVTYVDGSYHAGLAAGPVAYSASVAPSVYQSAAVAAAPAVAVASQPVVQSAAVAPIAYAAQATKYAAIPTVEHVPGVADVPVTRIDAQPGVIQKTVDLARPAVKTQRYEVRRPAIQKQFYDIEERVVVRPAGSAVVELDEPLSRTQKGPSVIRPTGEGVAVSSSVAAVPSIPTVPAISSVSSVSPAQEALPSVEINLARSSLGSGGNSIISASPAPVASVDYNLARSSISSSPAPAPASIPSVGINYARTSFAATSAPVVSSAPTALPSVNVNFARSSYGAPAASVVSASPAPLPSVDISLARSSIASAPVVASAPAPAPAPVAIPSANINLARSSFSAPVQTVSYSPAAYAPQSISVSAVPVKTISVSAPVQTATITGVSSVSAGSSGISSITPGVSFSTPAPQYQQQIVQTTPAPEYADDSVSIDSADFSLARSNQQVQARTSYQASGPQTFAAPAQAPSRETIFRSALPTRRYQPQTASSRGSLIVNYPNSLDLVPQSQPQFRAASVYSEGNIQSEINHGNQQRLIQLLTARGGVTEVGFGRSGGASYPVEAGEVRARVLSATPAPAYSAPAGERVNTRRVVVSRPIETLQEVEVNEPVTKYERVQVDQPTVIKTARQDVVRVPTSVPVYGKTLAPIAEAPVAYSAGWH